MDDGTTLAVRRAHAPSAIARAARAHWPEALIEAAGLGAFMLSACLFATLLEHPGSPVRQALHEPVLRRALMGLAMGLTAIALIYSAWGKRSGAHFNPSVTLAFVRTGRIGPGDATLYVGAQFAGAAIGMLLAAALPFGGLLSHPSVDYVVTRPAAGRTLAAFAAELAMSGALMLLVLRLSNEPALNRFTGLAAGAAVALYIALEAPLSGMSLNPARSFGSALAARDWEALWVYFVAPPLGMLLAAELHRRSGGQVLCCKLHHDNGQRCIFRCGWPHPSGRHPGAPEGSGGRGAATPSRNPSASIVTGEIR